MKRPYTVLHGEGRLQWGFGLKGVCSGRGTSAQKCTVKQNPAQNPDQKTPILSSLPPSTPTEWLDADSEISHVISRVLVSTQSVLVP